MKLTMVDANAIGLLCEADLTKPGIIETAAGDPKQTSRIARGSPTGDAMQLVCLVVALVAVGRALALFLPARLKIRMSFLAPRTPRWCPIGILSSQCLRGTPTHPARWSS